MAKIEELKGMYDLPDWFKDLPAVTRDEDEPARDLILMSILGIRSWVIMETERVKQERIRPFVYVHGLAVRNKMDRFDDLLWLLSASIEKQKGIFTRDDLKWGILDHLQDECNISIEVIHTSRPSFHPPIT